MLEIKHLTKTYRSKNNTVYALKDINLHIQDKGMVFILGKSGSGKSTLLNVLGGLDQFDQGEIIICGKSSRDFKQSDFDSYRNTFIGFIFQEYNVMENFTVQENIALALQLQGKQATQKEVDHILEEVDLTHLGNRKPNELSGGQLQRVAIARALIKNPEIIMADEPTGALDSLTGKQVFDTLKKLSEKKLVLIVSHDKEFAKQYADRIIELSDGQIVQDTSKDYVAPSQHSHEVTIIENELISIKNPQHLSSLEIENIIKEIQKHDQEVMISFHARTNQDIKKTHHMNEDGQIEVFCQTTPQHIQSRDYSQDKIQFIRSQLPFKSSMKFALSNLHLKPFRLAMTILLSVISFTMFGMTSTIAQYDRESATFHSIKDSQIDYISIGKNNVIDQGDYSYEEKTKITAQDYQKIHEKYPQLLFNHTFSSENDGTFLRLETHISQSNQIPQTDEQYLYPTSLSALSTINEQIIQKNHFQLKGNLPQKEYDIVIPQIIAETFVKFGYQTVDVQGQPHVSTIKSVEDLIGKTLSLETNHQSHNYTITGILDTHLDLSRYEILKDEHDTSLSKNILTSELHTLLNSGYHTLGYITPEHLEDIINQYHAYFIDTQRNNINIYMSQPQETTYIDVYSFYSTKDVDKQQLVKFSDGDIYLNYLSIKNIKVNEDSTIEDLVLEKIGTSDNEQTKRQAIRQIVSQYQEKILQSGIQIELSQENPLSVQNLSIAGVYIDFQTTEDNQTFVCSQETIDQYHLPRDGYADYIIAPMSDDQTLQDIISYTYDDDIKDTNYTLENQAMPMLLNVNSIIDTLANVFFVLGVILAAFASVLFCNFIATSITNKKREIGILRAVGARGVDVLKIFLNESLIIAFMNGILAIGACIVITIFANQYIREQFQILVTILNFGPLQIFIILLIAIGVACLASAIPVYKISHKKPIDAIKDRK